MLAVLGPVVAHQLQHLEQLLEVQVLLVGHHVQALGEIVGIMAVLYRRQVAGHVQSSAVRAQEHRRRHTVLVQLYDLSALILDQQPFFLEFVKHGLHLVDVEALTRIGIELHAQHIVHALGVL